MTEYDDREPDPAEDARIRALLADLGDQDLTMPPEVAARLDATLEGLAVEHAAAHASDEHRATGTVVPMRPRWMPRLAGAAAAVIVLGFGGFVVTHLGGVSQGDSAGEGAGSAGGGGGSVAGASGSAKSQVRGDQYDAATPRVRSAHFRADVRSALRYADCTSCSKDFSGGNVPAPTEKSPRRAPQGSMDAMMCVDPATTKGAELIPVRFDGRAAVLVVHPPTNGRQRVDAYSCEGGGRLASTTLPARD